MSTGRTAKKGPPNQQRRRKSSSKGPRQQQGRARNSNSSNANFRRPEPSQKRVPQRIAILGGGIAGLSCAQQLLKSNGDYIEKVTVFDTGRLRPGGRCSSRLAGDPMKPGDDREYPLLSHYAMDHAAQLVAVPSDEGFADFRQQIQAWHQDGILRPFAPQTLFRIDGSDASLTDLQPDIDSPKYYHASKGMASIPGAIVQSFKETSSSIPLDIQQDVWISPSNGVRYQFSQNVWKLQAKGQSLGDYDSIVVAHNGKCADRLMSRTPAKDLHQLLRVNFAATVAPQAKRMTLNSIYSLTVALPKNSFLDTALPSTFTCGFIEKHPDLSFLTCQTRKLQQKQPSQDTDVTVWTIFSSAKFAKRHKAPQEFLPDDTIDEVKALLLDSLQEVLSRDDGHALSRLVDSVLDCRLQLWGAALPLNIYHSKSASQGFIYDDDYSVGVCGDWLLDSSIAGAWTSGRRLADHLTDVAQSRSAWQQRGTNTQNNREAQTMQVGLTAGTFMRSDRAAQATIGSL